MVKIHCLKAFDDFTAKWGDEALDAYIDDLTITTQGTINEEAFDKIT